LESLDEKNEPLALLHGPLALEVVGSLAALVEVARPRVVVLRVAERPDDLVRRLHDRDAVAF
jgi:hypothetical protein